MQMKKQSLFLTIVMISLCLISCGEAPEKKTPVNYKEDETVEYEIQVFDETPIEPRRELFITKDFGLISDESKGGPIFYAAQENSVVIGKYVPNMGMRILDDTGDLLRIESGDVIGYLPKAEVLQGSPAKTQLFSHHDYWIEVNTDVLNVRLKPDDRSTVIAKIKEGQHYEVTEEQGNWLKIQLGFMEGYVSKEFCDVGYTSETAELSFDAKDVGVLAQKAITFGFQYLGNPYVYGGNSLTNGCDCSYFTAMCLYQAGIIAGRTSREQAKKGREISISELRPGDLVFYKFQSDEINHVAMYIGNGKIIQAAESVGCISVNPYNYCGEPCMARRYFE